MAVGGRAACFAKPFGWAEAARIAGRLHGIGKLTADFQAYIFGWLVGYSGLLGPVAAIVIVDYWIVRRQELNLRDLYVDGGEYPLVHWPAMIALAVGVGLALVGVVVPTLRSLYDYAWFVGFAAAGTVYLLLARRPRP